MHSLLQVQNLAMRGVASTKGTSVKTEVPERNDSGRAGIEGLLLDSQCNLFSKHNITITINQLD